MIDNSKGKRYFLLVSEVNNNSLLFKEQSVGECCSHSRLFQYNQPLAALKEPVDPV